MPVKILLRNIVILLLQIFIEIDSAIFQTFLKHRFFQPHQRNSKILQYYRTMNQNQLDLDPRVRNFAKKEEIKKREKRNNLCLKSLFFANENTSLTTTQRTIPNTENIYSSDEHLDYFQRQLCATLETDHPVEREPNRKLERVYPTGLLIQPRQTAACFPSKLYPAASRAAFAFAFRVSRVCCIHPPRLGYRQPNPRPRYKSNRVLKLCESTGHPLRSIVTTWKHRRDTIPLLLRHSPTITRRGLEWSRIFNEDRWNDRSAQRLRKTLCQ